MGAYLLKLAVGDTEVLDERMNVLAGAPDAATSDVAYTSAANDGLTVGTQSTFIVTLFDANNNPTVRACPPASCLYYAYFMVLAVLR